MLSAHFNYVNQVALKIFKKQTLVIISAAIKLEIPWFIHACDH